MECPIDTFSQETTASVVCRDPEPSTCGDLLSYFLTPAEYVVQNGCLVLTCSNNTLPFIKAQFQFSEITPPNGFSYLTAFEISPPNSLEEMGGASLAKHFGIICDDDVWKATKYPNGITYTLAPPSFADGSLDGKKTDVLQISW
ncbi:Sushi domain-containing protein [Caenorhabditis elegans]|uniref:Sushi domain-containing protein n=1 Tax=Caenorhabditis elegans TaxID=6239 RepID=O76591_CAEEL|nr:Sushi domain-containing protein [Caenorhabditis elegans]CCD69602.1 Sushi domain-containing protein [Caenorhabditis elegans]|eukprot:NP_494260.2 Uncharacterized protein CELE_F16G10.6 [Caenorhabditis elegans]